MTTKPVYAISVFNDGIKGTVKFSEDLTNDRVKIDLKISGLIPNSLHGFHVHEAGDLTDKCTSMCSHFNPYGNTACGYVDPKKIQKTAIDCMCVVLGSCSNTAGTAPTNSQCTCGSASCSSGQYCFKSRNFCGAKPLIK